MFSTHSHFPSRWFPIWWNAQWFSQLLQAWAQSLLLLSLSKWLVFYTCSICLYIQYVLYLLSEYIITLILTKVWCWYCMSVAINALWQLYFKFLKSSICFLINSWLHLLLVFIGWDGQHGRSKLQVRFYFHSCCQWKTPHHKKVCFFFSFYWFDNILYL